MKRSIITTDGNGNITLPTDISATAMSEWELCDLFGVTAPTFRAGLKALCKSGVLREYGIRRSIRVSDNSGGSRCTTCSTNAAKHDGQAGNSIWLGQC